MKNSKTSLAWNDVRYDRNEKPIRAGRAKENETGVRVLNTMPVQLNEFVIQAVQKLRPELGFGETENSYRLNCPNPECASDQFMLSKANTPSGPSTRIQSPAKPASIFSVLIYPLNWSVLPEASPRGKVDPAAPKSPPSMNLINKLFLPK